MSISADVIGNGNLRQTYLAGHALPWQYAQQQCFKFHRLEPSVHAFDLTLATSDLDHPEASPLTELAEMIGISIMRSRHKAMCLNVRMEAYKTGR